MDNKEMAELIDVIRVLRAPEGCEWDKAQTHQSMRKHMLEEAYEVCEAIDREDGANLLEELGDVLFQVAFHAEMAREEDLFDFNDVARAATEKMKRRHPQIFAGEDAALFDWEAIKAQEKKSDAEAPAVPRALPSLMRLQKLVHKLEKVGESKKTLEACATSEEEQALLALVVAVDNKNLNAEEEAQKLCEKLEICLKDVKMSNNL